jgi:hypothetical protein
MIFKVKKNKGQYFKVHLNKAVSAPTQIMPENTIATTKFRMAANFIGILRRIVFNSTTG